LTGLSKQEKEALEMLLTCQPSVVIEHMKISKGHLGQIKTRVRRKEAKAKKLLLQLNKYKNVLYTSKKYKGI